MPTPLHQHHVELQRNRAAWTQRPLLRSVYADLYRRIAEQVDPTLPGRLVEIGSGIGNLRDHLPEVVRTDLFPGPAVHLACDGYDLPFRDCSLSHLLLLDVFHHLEAPAAFLQEARRTLCRNGRVIILDPFISWLSWPIYGGCHHEPVAWYQPISSQVAAPKPRHYYAAQGNATRSFFPTTHQPPPPWLAGWTVVTRSAWASVSYLLSGGFSGPSLAPLSWHRALIQLDRFLSQWPQVFGLRCIVCLARTDGSSN